MNRTPIEWTTFSANPLKYRDSAGRVVWGCVHKSAGCAHCYSEALAKRYARGGPFAAQVMKHLTPFMDKAELRHMVKAKRVAGKPVAGGRCFVGDMTDLFGEWVPDELLDQLFAVFALRQDVTWQVLTKRADRMRRWFEPVGQVMRRDFVRYAAERFPHEPRWTIQAWPLPNVWLGVSVEDQATADERIPLLLQTPAAVRFVSYEPALGPVDFRAWLPNEIPKEGRRGEYSRRSDDRVPPSLTFLDWVICGGESGPGARPFDVEWARNTLRQCREAGVACFYKQGGASNRCQHDRKGGHFECFPDDLKVREFPRAA